MPELAPVTTALFESPSSRPAPVGDPRPVDSTYSMACRNRVNAMCRTPSCPAAMLGYGVFAVQPVAGLLDRQYRRRSRCRGGSASPATVLGHRQRHGGARCAPERAAAVAVVGAAAPRCLFGHSVGEAVVVDLVVQGRPPRGGVRCTGFVEYQRETVVREHDELYRGVVVGELGGFRRGPGIAVVRRDAAVDGVSPAAAEEGHQGAVGSRPMFMCTQPALSGTTTSRQVSPLIVGDHHAAVVAIADPLAAPVRTQWNTGSSSRPVASATTGCRTNTPPARSPAAVYATRPTFGRRPRTRVA